MLLDRYFYADTITMNFNTNGGEWFQTFCNQTTLHGWQYIVIQEPGHKSRVYFWTFIVTLSMVTAGIFLYNNTWDFMHTNVVTTVDTMTAPLNEVYFPSLVVCNINQVRASFFEEIVAKVGLNNENITLDNEMGESHQLCEDMFIFSKWNSSVTFHFESQRDFGTDYGICCWYTPQFNFTEIIEHSKNMGLTEPDWGYWFTNIKKGAKTGKDNGYTILLDIESFDYEFFKEGSEGLKVALVHHLDMPIIRQIGFHIAPGTENQNAMERFSPEQRDCYSESEINLKYLPRDHGYRYEMSNCLFEATFEHILSQCQCFPGFHTTAGTSQDEYPYTICNGPKLSCVNELMNRMGQFDHVDFNGEKVKCRSNCEDQMNSVFVTSSAYPNKSVFVERPEYCLLLTRLLQKCRSFKRGPLQRSFPTLCQNLEPVRKLVKMCHKIPWKVLRTEIPDCTAERCPLEDEIWLYARKNLAVLNIFIKDPYAKRYLKDAKTTKTSYVANSGGILGLCMGFSLISAAEIVYHCFGGIFKTSYSDTDSEDFSIRGGESVASNSALDDRLQETLSPSDSIYPLHHGCGHHHCLNGPVQHQPYCELTRSRTNQSIVTSYGPERII